MSSEKPTWVVRFRGKAEWRFKASYLHLSRDGETYFLSDSYDGANVVATFPREIVALAFKESSKES